MVTKIKTEFYNTIETITLPLTKLEVKYIKPDVIQASEFQAFIVDSVSKLTLTPNQINGLTYLELRTKANDYFQEKSTEEISSLFGEMTLLGMHKLLNVIEDCFPEVSNSRLVKGAVLDDMIKVLFSTVFNQ